LAAFINYLRVEKNDVGQYKSDDPPEQVLDSLDSLSPIARLRAQSKQVKQRLIVHH
jgi:hypothetical protein